MLRRRLATLAVLVALPLLGLPAWIALHRTDLHAPDDSDLLIEIPEVPAEEDAYVWFRRAADAVVWNDVQESYDRLRAIEMGEASDPEWIQAMMSVNTRAYLLLEAGLAAPGIDLPPWTLDAGDEDPMLALLPGQTLVRLAAADSLRRAGSGDPAAALEAALLGMRVGWKLSTAAEPQLVGMMLGVGAQRTSLAALERLLPQLSLSARQARELAGRLDGWRWPEGAWRAAWRAEYRFVRNATGQVASGEMAEEDLFPRDSPGVLQLPWWLPRDYRFQPNRTLSRAADMFRELGAWSEKPCAANAASAGEDDLGALDVFRPNGAGRIALGIARPNFTHFDRRRCQHATRISLVQALLALHTYRGEHGTLPDTLEALVPDHLDAVPEDRFDGQPIRWSREQATLYSVGDDFVDDGPPEAPSQRDERAPAIRLPDRPVPTPAPTAS